MRYKIQGGYIDLEPESKIREISDKLSKIAKGPTVNELESGKKQGDPEHFVTEK